MVSDFTSKYLLTIYVLSYENAACVRELLCSLLPLERDDVCIVVGDDSDRTNEVQQVVADLEAHFRDRLLLHPNPVRLGMVGNILRPFELVRSSYVWVVGACNHFMPDALAGVTPFCTGGSPMLS